MSEAKTIPVATLAHRIRALSVRPLAAPALVAAAVFWVAYDGGSYAETSRGTIAIGVWWTIGLCTALGVWPKERIPRAALVVGGLLAALALWTGLSVFWAESDEKAVDALDSVLLYLGAFALAVLAASRGEASRWRAGLALGTTGVGLLALASRLFPERFPEDELPAVLQQTGERLSYPIGYWNALATLLAFAFPLLLSIASAATRPFVRGLALAPVPALAAAVYLTSSRGGTGVAVLGTLTFVALTSRRWAAVGAAAVGGVGTAVAVMALVTRSAVADEPGSRLAVEQGRQAAGLIALACLGTGALYGLGTALRLPAPRLGRAGRVVLAVVALVVLAGIVLAAKPGERIDSFRRDLTSEERTTSGHLLSGSGRGRVELWQAAIDAFESRPLNGRGAGSYEAWWIQHRTIDGFVRDAHSLYLETLGELGLVGFVLLVAMLVAAGVVGVTRLRGSPDRAVAAALLAVLVAFCLEAGVDWIWEVPAVSLALFAAAGLLTGPATLPATGASHGGPLGGARRTGLVALALAALALQALPLLSRLQLEESYQAAARGDLAEAQERALGSARLEPWAASPRVQLALVHERRGDLAAALAEIAKAIERDETDWRLRLVAARLETKAGRIAAAKRSLAEARRLNPRSPFLEPN